MDDTAGVITVRAVRNGREWREVKAIRRKVFIEEQSCPPDEEWDQHDRTSRHLIGMLDGAPIATARWRTVWHDGRQLAKLERFAVLAEHRGHGYGRSLVEKVIEDARLAGYDRYIIHAQRHLEPFYASLGFETFGDVFEEAGIPHVKMRRIR